MEESKNGVVTEVTENPSVFGMILNPTKQFERIRQNPKFLIALIVVTIMTAIGMALMAQGMDFSSDMDEFEGLGEEEMFVVTIITQIGFIIAGLFTPIVTIVISSAILLIIAKIAKSDVTFKQLFSMNTHTYMISAVGVILNGLLTLFIPTSNPEVYITSLYSIIEAEGALGGLLQYLEVFSIWMLIVTGIGLQVVAKFSKKLAWTIVIIFFLIGLLFVTVGAAIGATLGV